MNELYLSILTGLSIGFLGSFHCIGMCGPIALALPVHTFSGVQKYVGIFLYNLGRAVTYSLLGFAFGFVGSQFRLWGLQQVISIGAGVLILLFILSRFSFASKVPGLATLNLWVQRGLGKLLKTAKNSASLFPVGLLNGLLPCGLVYVAIAAALATMSSLNAMLLMFSFGIGTIPVMAGLMMFGHLLSINIRQKINRSVPYFVGLMAVMLILRGMNLGIPYLSPKLEKESTEVSCCHKPQ
ncbi:MAG: sulfite exporter TauE/SafE family protein [Saprospiraceae bacterium]|nr:sulfite exporter TauE/SafE family protein [Saprospiraceae bacterium]